MTEKVVCLECGAPVMAILAAKRGGLGSSCALKHEEKVTCVECGKPISAKLAGKRNGLCLRCSAKRNPFFVLAMSLVERVHHSPSGFDGLSDPEKTYYALTHLEDEVNNGGFHQFFFNSSGAYYDLIEKGLASFDEPQILELLRTAKEIAFPDYPVPTDRELRRRLLPAPNTDQGRKLNELDQRFYRMPSTLRPKLEQFARERGLVPTDSTG